MKFSVFAKAIQKCDIILKSYGIFLMDILTNSDKNISDNVINLFLGLVGLQVKKLSFEFCKYILPRIKYKN